MCPCVSVCLCGGGDGGGAVRALETIYRPGFSIKLTSPVQECSGLRQWAKWSCLNSKERSRSF